MAISPQTADATVGQLNMTIKIMHKNKVHYTGESYNDPLIQEAAGRIAYEWQVFGESLYWIDWGSPTSTASDTACACGYRGQKLSAISACPSCGYQPPCA